MPPHKQEFFSQTDDSSLEPAGSVTQLAGIGVRPRGVCCEHCLAATRCSHPGRQRTRGTSTGTMPSFRQGRTDTINSKRSGCSSFPGILACSSCSCCFGLSDAGVSVFPPTRGARRAPGLWPVEQTSVMSIGEPRPPQPVL